MFELLYWGMWIFIYGVVGLLLTELIGNVIGNPLDWPRWGRAVLWPIGVVLLFWDAFGPSSHAGDEE